MQLSQKPKLLTCYSCGRQFGTTSLGIHLKSCLRKFENQQSKKQVKDQRTLPKPPEELQQILNGNLSDELVTSYNQKALNMHKYEVLSKCKFCNRTFNEQSLKVHEKGCDKKGNQKIEQKSSYDLPDSYKKPRTLTCCICGRDFGLSSLKIHYPQCLQKFKFQQNKKPKSDRKQPPKLTQKQIKMINNKQDWTLQQIEQFNKKANENYKQKVMVQCPNCGRKFIQTSYLKHKKNCVLINGNQGGVEVPKIGRDVSSQQLSSLSLGSEFRSTSTQFKKPRTLTCCVCGRDFGLFSLKIHYPQCLQKFINDQEKKPKAQRKQPPKFSEEQLKMITRKLQEWTLEQIQQFNNKANSHYRDKAMFQCENCGRKFVQQSYHKHKKNCVLINGNLQSNTSLSKSKHSASSQSFRPTSPQYKKPRTLTCCVCGRDFGLTSLKIHYPQCLQKFSIQQEKKPKNQRKVAPQFSEQQLLKINKKEDWTLEQIQQFNNKANSHYRDKAMVECQNCGRKFIQQSYLKHKKNCELINGKNLSKNSSTSQIASQVQVSQPKKPNVLMCFICGRQFGLTSLIIHQPQCEQKFINMQKKKPIQQRKPLPIFPQNQLKNYDLIDTVNWSSDKIQQYNKIANQVYRKDSLYACQICGRKFFEQSLPKHLKYCKKNKQKQQSLQKKGASNSVDKQMKSIKKQNKLKKTTSLSKIPSLTPNQKIQQHKDEYLDSTPKQQIREQNLDKNKQQIQNKVTEFQPEIQKINQVEQSMQQTWKQNQISKITKQQQKSQKKSFLNEQKQVESQQNIEKQQKKQQQQIQIQNSQKQLSQKQTSIQVINNSKQNQINSQPNNQIIQQNKDININSLKTSQNLLQQNKQQTLQKQQQNQQLKQIVSPSHKMRSSMNFAAPRKKQQSIQANMKQCKICNRKFTQERIQKHQKLCLQNKQRQKKSEKTLNENKLNTESIITESKQNKIQKPSQIKQRDILSPEQKIRLKKGFAAPRQKQTQAEGKMVECRGCKRKFAQDRIEKHQSICKQAQEQLKQPLATGTYKKLQQISGEEEKVSLKRQPCPKCNRKFAQQRLQKHLQICKSIPPIKYQPQSALKKNIQKIQPLVIKQNFENKIENFEQISLQLCEKCGRKFNIQRISKHQAICKGKLNQIETANITSKGFKKQKQEIPTKQYNLDQIQIKDQKQCDERVQCSKCLRKFASDRIQKHINACKAVPTINPIQNQKKVAPKLQLNPLKQKPHFKPSIQSPKATQAIMKTIGQDQYIQAELAQCIKCSRKFAIERLQKHTQICKGINKIKSPVERLEKNSTEMAKRKPSKAFEEQVRKTKNQFFNMMKDLKCKKVNEDDIEKQLDYELLEIQQTNKLSRKQNSNRQNRNSSQRKKNQQQTNNINKSIILPKI